MPLRLKEGADLIVHVLLEFSDEAQDVGLRREVVVFDQSCEVDTECDARVSIYTQYEFKPCVYLLRPLVGVASLERVHLRLQQTVSEDMRIIPLKVSCWP